MRAAHMPRDLFAGDALVSTPEMQQPASVLILDDDDDMRALLGETVHRLTGVEVTGAPDVASLIELGDRALHCSLAILDVNLGPGQPSGIDAYLWLEDHGYTGKVVFLTGHAKNHPLVQQAHERRAVRVLQKPIGVGTIRDLLQEPAG